MEHIDMEQYRRQIEAVKLSVVGAAGVTGFAANQMLVDAIGYLYENFLRMRKKELLLQALVQIQAYLEMGFVYEDNEQLFDRIIEGLDTKKNFIFPKKYYAAKKIKLNWNSVRSMIKKWPRTNDRKYTIDELISDIIDKVKNKKYGIYYYQSTQGKAKSIVGMYELVVNSNESYFYDLISKKYYVFEDE